MIRLEDRLRIALGAGMGCALLSTDVETVTRMIVVLRELKRGAVRRHQTNLIDEALQPLESEP